MTNDIAHIDKATLYQALLREGGHTKKHLEASGY